MPSALEKVIESFPHPTIQSIVGQPTYETLAEVHLKLNRNAASTHSHLGNEKLNILFLTIAPAIYNTQSNIAFIPPANTDPYHVANQDLTAAQISDTRRQYDVNLALYTEYDMTDKALKYLRIAAVDKTYIQYLQDTYIGYANITTKEMLAHHYLAYAKNLYGDIDYNDKPMRANYNVNQTMEVLIEQIDDAVDIADASKNSYLEEQVVTAAYNPLFKTGMFANDCKI